MTQHTTLAQRLTALWYARRPGALAWVLWPLSLVFRAVVMLRRASYRMGLRPVARFDVPIVIVGNITVGGSGKTPLVRSLAAALGSKGWRPGVVSRGYGGGHCRSDAPRAVLRNDDARLVGDEALLLAADQSPVWIGRDRPAAVRALLAANPQCNVVIADDGLQHYALHRDVEIAVIDVARGLGNGLLLPAGPLREAPLRLEKVDLVVELIDAKTTPARGRFGMTLEALSLRGASEPQRQIALADLDRRQVHAIAGIGNPERFFSMLRAMGLTPICHAFPDHYSFTADDLRYPEASAILMTEKDAVKCRAFADSRCWMVPVHAVIPIDLVRAIERKLARWQR